MKTSRITKFARFAIGLGSLVAIGSLMLFLLRTAPLSWSAPIDTETFSHFGELIGGVAGTLFSLAAVFLLIQNISDQQSNFTKHQLENQFVEQIKFHRRNSADIYIGTTKGAKVFQAMITEFKVCFEVISTAALTKQLPSEDKINIAYLSLFYGARGEASRHMLSRMLFKKYKEEVVSATLEAFRSLQRQSSDIKPIYYYFEGHQARLGHYYRHLYLTVKFIDLQPAELLTFDQKYDHVKLLRAQLSTQEQAMLFLNSMSSLGAPWEKAYGAGEVKKHLITKYNLIKNIPDDFFVEIDLEDYYPHVHYEGREKTRRRIQLEEIYRS